MFENIAAVFFINTREWSVNDITCIPEELGLSGSPTKVKNIENIPIFFKKQTIYIILKV